MMRYRVATVNTVAAFKGIKVALNALPEFKVKSTYFDRSKVNAKTPLKLMATFEHLPLIRTTAVTDRSCQI